MMISIFSIIKRFGVHITILTILVFYVFTLIIFRISEENPFNMNLSLVLTGIQINLSLNMKKGVLMDTHASIAMDGKNSSITQLIIKLNHAPKGWNVKKEEPVLTFIRIKK